MSLPLPTAETGSPRPTHITVLSCSMFLDGVGQFQVEDRIFPVSANDLVIINPNVSHTELGFHANPLKYIVLGIENLELSVANEGENFCIVSFREIKETMNFT